MPQQITPISNCDPAVPIHYLMYFDVNYLYGLAMTQFLPYGSFKWADVTLRRHVADDSLDVDLMYPDHFHELHQNLPYCPENKTPPGSKEPQLLTTL